MSQKRNSFKKLMDYMRPDFLQYFFATLFGLYKFMVPVFLIWIFGMSIEVITDFGNGIITSDQAWSTILKYSMVILATIIVSPLPVYYRSLFAAKATSKTITRIRCDLYRHIHRLSHSFFDKTRSGSLVSRVIGDIENVQRFLENAFIALWMHMGKAAIIIVYLLSINWVLTLVAASLIPLQIFIFLRIGANMKQVSINVRNRTAELAGNTQEKLAGVTVVKSFTGESQEQRLFENHSDKLLKAKVKAGSISGISQAVIQLLNNIGPLLILMAGGAMAIFRKDFVTVGELVQFMMLQRQLYEPFSQLSETILISAEAFGSMDRIDQIFDIRPDVDDAESPIDPSSMKGEIELADVHFSYNDQTRYILSGIDLKISAGETTALVGESGGGKSTVIKLINRFYDVVEGKVLIDGIDVKDYSVQKLREKIALVPQEPVLFSGSIKENILYGRMNATDEEILEAAEKAFALDFINRLPEGIDTKVGERGSLLSGGQRQRISIARAFLKDPAIIIFDEATSALDNESEQMIQKAMDNLLKNRTAIIIAHRLSTIADADRIVVIEEGKVVESGTHKQLMKQKNRYYELSTLSES